MKNHPRKPNPSVQIMGVLNCTPDSFYDGGRHNERQAALCYADEMVAQGVDIIDIGGESSRPGAQPVTVAEETARVVPVVDELHRLNPQLPISVDTCKPEVAAAALQAGAVMINDITGFAHPEMIQLLIDTGCQGVMMHMLGTPRTMQQNPQYREVVRDIYSFFEKRLTTLANAGVDLQKIIVDPGIGFGKSVQHNLILLRRLREFKRLGQRLLVGASRKSFIGKILDLPEDERLEGSLAVAMVGYLNGADVLRVHDVAATRRALTVAQAIVESI